MKILLYQIIFILSGISYSFADPAFRLHISSEPASLSPFIQKSSSGSYLFTQLHSPLLWVQNGKLKDYLGHCTQKDSKHIKCEIFKWAKFSNGEPITAKHFVETFREFLNPKNPAYRADLLTSLKNAKEALDGKVTLDKIGIRGAGQNLEFELESPNFEFLFNLGNPILSPVYDNSKKNGPFDDAWVVSGPFKLKSWIPKQKITLISNPHFPGSRPDLEFQFITEDSIALNMYEKNELDFLRRLPTLYISKYKDRPDFFAIDQFRFDFIALNSKIPLEIREQLINLLDLKELQNLLLAKPSPGCVGITSQLNIEPICLLMTKKTILEKVEGKKTQNHFTYLHSKQGGDDQNRIAQWFQSEWNKNKTFEILVSEIENKVFIDELKKRSPSIFHKGLTPDRPTCAAVLENFKKNAAENYIDFENINFEKLVTQLSTEKSAVKKQKLCSQALHILMDAKNLIPLGPIYFSILSKPEWKNWTLNELNQLNLSQLKWEKNR